MTSTDSSFSCHFKVQLTGTATQPNYQDGFGIVFHNEPTQVAGGSNMVGLEGYSPSIACVFRPLNNEIRMNGDGFGWSNLASGTATNGIIFGSVYVWIDLVRTTHQWQIRVSNSSTKPTNPDLTYTRSSALATYFQNQVYFTIGSQGFFVSTESNTTRDFEFEYFQIVTAASGNLPALPSPTPSPSPGPSPGPSPAPATGNEGTTLLGINSTTGNRIAFPNGTKKRVFFIGNSLTDTVKYIALDAIATAQGYEHLWGRQMIPGAPLSWLWDNIDQGFVEQPYGGPTQALPGFTWDDVSFQPYDRSLNSDRQYINLYLDLVRQNAANVNNTRPWIYQRWFGTTRTTTYTAATWAAEWDENYDTVAQIGGDNATRDFFELLVDFIRADNPDLAPALLIPIGEVMYNLNAKMGAGEIPGYDSMWDLYSDGIHLTESGAYICTCTAYATLYWKDPRGTAVPTASGAVDPVLVTPIQETVWETVFNYDYAGFNLGSSTGGNPTPVNRPPVAVIEVSALEGLAPLTVNFSASGSYDLDTDDSVVGFEWNFGNGNTSVQVSSSQTYETAGSYTVTLRVQDESGAWSSPVTRTINVQASAGNGTTTFLSNAQELEVTALANQLGMSNSALVGVALDLAEGLYKVANSMSELS